MRRLGTDGTAALLLVVGLVACAAGAAAVEYVQPMRDGREEGNFRTDSRTPETAALDTCATITEPGRYRLTANLTDSRRDTCIRIAARNVTLDGDGHAVDGVGAFGSAGVLVQSGAGASPPLANVVVRNVSVIDWDDGIRYIGVSGGEIRETTTANNRIGVSLVGTSDVTVRGNTARANDVHGMSVLESSRNNRLVNNALTGNALFGVRLVGDGVRRNRVAGNEMRNNEFGVVLVGVADNDVVDNAATGNRIAGVWLSAADRNRVEGNTVSNRFYGIYLADHADENRLVGNVARRNQVGIRLRTSDRNRVERNVLESNADNAVLLISSDGNAIVGNEGDGNRRGITLLRSSGTTLRNNSVGTGRADSSFGSRCRPSDSCFIDPLEAPAMSLEEILTHMPFAEHLDIEVTDAADGRAEARLALDDYHSSVPGRAVGHGGVAYALADTVAGAAVISLHFTATPTIDMRIDYLAPVRTDLVAEAEVVRDGSSVAVAEATIEDVDGTHVAAARGTFKTSGAGDESAWGSGAPGSLRTNGAGEEAGGE